MALSCYDLQLTYRGTLCMRFSFQSGANPTVKLSDGCHNQGATGSPQSRGGGVCSDIYPVQGFVSLPAFQVGLGGPQGVYFSSFLSF